MTDEELKNLEQFNGPERDGVAANAEAWEVNYIVKEIRKLRSENARLRQQRDAANAQLDFILENLNNESK